ncbi:Flavodoxin [Lachnospiraceae bacterium]|nr:Flavodoxin [Lachnospiraceae bacterium]
MNILDEEDDYMSNILVAYFSASGVTKKVAENLAKAAGADLFEIVPEQIYTSEDLNWHNKQSRSSVEMDDKKSRPAISSKIEDIKQYSHVFVGFPVWWYREPSIIDTFMESYDWNGITVIPFCTSGGSGIGDAGKNMQALGKGAKVNPGRRLSGNASEAELKAWANQIL